MTHMDTILNEAFTAALGEAYTGLAPIPGTQRSDRAKRIARAEAERVDATLADMQASNRGNELTCRARQAVMYRLRRELGWSTPRIGRFLGDRHHTTIINGIRAHERRMKEEG